MLLKFLIIIFLIAFSLAPRTVYSQDCGTAVSRAEHAYELGAFHDVLDILAPCLPAGLSEDDIWRGFRLQAISYLMIDQPDSAEESVRQMLRRNPFYTAVPGQDPYEFVSALSQFATYARFSGGIVLEEYDPIVQVLQANTVTQATSGGSSYSQPLATDFGAEFLYQYLPGLWAGTDLLLSSQQLTRSTIPVSGTSTDYTENLSSLDLPLFVRFRIADWSVAPFVEAGAFAQFFTSFGAKVTIARTVPNQSSSTSLVVDNNPSARRKNLNYGWNTALGVTMPLSPTIDVQVRGRYWHGLVDLTKPAARYSSSLFLPAYYEDDDIALHGFEFSVGLHFLFGFHEYRYEK